MGSTSIWYCCTVPPTLATSATPGTELSYPLGSKRHAWLHVIDGDVNVNGTELHTGDAVAADNEESLNVIAKGAGNSEILLFDLA